MSQSRVPRALVRCSLPLLLALGVATAGACAAESEVSAGGTGGSSETTTSTAAPKSDLTVTAEEDGTGALVVVVDDGAAPGGSAARQCVHVRVSPVGEDVAVAEASSCNPDADGAPYAGSTVDADGTVVTPLIASVGGVEIGSACAVEPMSAPAADPAPLRTEFRFDAPADLEPGPYEVTVSATSGAAQGCPGDPGSAGAADDAAEHRARTSAKVDLG